MLENTTALFLANGLVGGSLVLLAGCLLCFVIREPVYRLRLIAVTLFATGLAFGVSILPQLPRWSLLTSAQRDVVQNVAAPPAAMAAESNPELQAATDSHLTRHSVGDAVPVTVVPTPRADRTAGFDVDRTKTRATAPAARVMTRLSGPMMPREFFPQLIRVVVTGYVLCVAALVCWWAVGVLRLIQIIRAAKPAGSSEQKLLRRISGRDDPRVRLVVTSRVRQPIACRAYGRVIVLPESLVESGSRQEIRFALAHEWSHIDRGDWWLWSLANLIRAAFLFHPSAWWLRRQTRLCQDFLADARAADQPGARIDYAEFLTKQATVRRQPVLAAGLGMRGRRSELYQRVLLLVKRERPVEAKCSRRWACGMLVVFLGIGITAGSGQVFTGETRQPDRDEDSAETGSAGEGAEKGTAEPRENDGQGSEADRDVAPGEVLSEGELQVQFEDQNESLCLQLTAVSEPRGAKSLWWEPNGKVLRKSSLRRWLSAESLPVRDAGGNYRAFLLQFWKHDRVSVRWLVDGVSTKLLNSESVEIGDRRLTTILFGGAFPEDDRTATVRVGYAAGPWRTTVVLSGRARESAVEMKSEGSVVGFEIPVPGPAASHDIRVIAVSESGLENQASLITRKTGSLVAQFRGLTPKAVREYRLESRPFRWMKFEKVSLSQGVATACRIVRDDQAPPKIDSASPLPGHPVAPVTGGPATGLVPPREELRYDGRSFRQWRRELLTELNPARRAEAMRAFSAFGRNGYTTEAAEAILDATQRMRKVSAGDDESEPVAQFRQAALTALLDLKPESVVDVLAGRMAKLDEENVEFIANWIEAAASDERTSAGLKKTLSARLPVFIKAAESANARSKAALLKSLRAALPKDARLKQ